MNRPNEAFPARSEPGESDEINLIALVGTIWRGKWLISLFVILFMAAGGYYALGLAEKAYPASAVVVMDTPNESPIGGMGGLMPFGGTDRLKLNTEEVVLSSRELIGRLVDTLDLTQDPEFNPQLREQSASLIAPLLSFLPGAGEEREPPTPEEVRYNVIDNVIGAVSATNMPESLAFRIQVTSDDPYKSVRIANTLADLYIEEQLQVKFAASERAATFLSERVAELRQTLESSEAELNALRERSTLVTQEGFATKSAGLKSVRERLENNRNALRTQQARLSSARSLLASGDYAALAELTENARLTNTVEARTQGRVDAEAVERAAEAVIAGLERDAARLRLQIDALVESEEELGTEIEAQSKELIELQNRERETQATRLMYETLLKSLQETEASRGYEQSDSRVLSRAVPRPASWPRPVLILFVSMVLGGFVGVVVVISREVLHTAFRTPDDLAAATGKVVMGTVPMVPLRGRKRTLTYLKEKPTSIFAEAIRNLRTSVLLSNVDKPPQLLMVTSSVMGEGKSTISITLAQNIASLGKRVLLIEGDIRRRSFPRYFDTRACSTILEALMDPEMLATTDLYNDEIGLDVLVGMKTKVNAADMYASARFKTMMDRAREHYDYIVIDTPPVLVVPDARVIGQEADAILFVVRWDSTTRTQATQGLEMFSSVGLNVTGLVLSQVDPSRMKAYGYGGQYGYGGGRNRYYETA